MSNFASRSAEFYILFVERVSRVRFSFYVHVQIQLLCSCPAAAFCPGLCLSKTIDKHNHNKMHLCRKRLANTDDVVCITKAEAETKRMRNAELQLANKNIENACLRHEHAKLVQGNYII